MPSRRNQPGLWRRLGSAFRNEGLVDGRRRYGRVVTNVNGLIGTSFPTDDDFYVPTEGDALSIPTWTGIIIKLGGLLARTRLRVVDDEMEEIPVDAVRIWNRDVDMKTLTRYRYDYGNALVIVNGEGANASMTLAHPDRVRIKPGGNYELKSTNRKLDPSRVLHFSSPIRDGKYGFSMRELCKRELANSIRASQYAGATFTQDPQGSLVLVNKTGIGGTGESEDRAAEGGDSLPDYRGPQSRGKAMELFGDFDVIQMTPKAHDAQLLDTRKFQGLEICRFLNMPPVLAGHQEGSSVYGPGIRAIESARF